MEVREAIAASRTLCEAVDIAGKEYRGHPAMIFREKPGDPYSGSVAFEQLPILARTLATSLVSQFGVSQDQNIGFLSENRYEYNTGDIAVLYAGAVPWGLYDYDVKNTEMVEYKMTDSSTEIMFVSPNFLQSMRSIVRSGKTPLKKLVVMAMPSENVSLQSNEYSFRDMTDGCKPDNSLVDARVSLLTPDSTSRIIYTSGTTGKPKGVMLTHNNLISNIKGLAEVLSTKQFGRLFSFLPEAHSFQGFLSYLSILGGIALSYANKRTIIDDIKDVQPTILPGVPLVFKRFAEGMREKVLHITKGKIDITADYSKQPVKRFIRSNVIGPLVRKKAGLSMADPIVSGSAKLDQEHARALRSIGIQVFEGYGISETSPVISLETPKSNRVGSVGKPLPNLRVRILSIDTDDDGNRRELPPGEHGEICVKGPNVFKGYYKDDQKTAEAKKDGEYFTGDLGHLDSDGFLYVHGRAGLQVKMNNGEFVDLDQLAAGILRNTVLIQAAVVDAEMADYAVAIISLAWEPEALQQIGASLGAPFEGDVKAFARNEKVIAAVKKEIEERASLFGGRSPSTARKFLYVPPMSPETGEITSTMKLRVKNVIKKYKEQLENLRDSDQTFMVYMP